MNETGHHISDNKIPTEKISVIDISNHEQVSKDQALKTVVNLITPITLRFTKKFEIINEDEKSNYHYVLIEFSEPKVKQPIPPEKARIIFKLNKNPDKKSKSNQRNDISFKIENEAVFFNFFTTINHLYFEVI